MENLPIDTKSLPSRLFYSEEEDKVYVGEPGDYKEVGGGDILPSEEGKFLVGGATDWEKRGITGHDVGISQNSASRVPYWNAGTQSWISGGMQVSLLPSSGTIAARTAGPDIGRLKANPAVEENDLVPLGQLNTILENLELPADQVSYDNTASGLLAETVQEAVDEVQGNVEQEATDRQLAIETAGFAPRTGTEIHFDKWATYDSYGSPSDGDFSYDLTNAVVGMIQVAYHEDSLVPTFSQAGISVMITGEYQPDVVNKISFELIALDRILINIKAL